MPEPLTDEQLTELKRLANEARRCGAFIHPDYAHIVCEAAPALIAEVRALRWLAKVVESSETWLKSKSGLQPKAILSALDKWRRVSGE